MFLNSIPLFVFLVLLKYHKEFSSFLTCENILFELSDYINNPHSFSNNTNLIYFRISMSFLRRGIVKVSQYIIYIYLYKTRGETFSRIYIHIHSLYFSVYDFFFLIDEYTPLYNRHLCIHPPLRVAVENWVRKIMMMTRDNKDSLGLDIYVYIFVAFFIIRRRLPYPIYVFFSILRIWFHE